MSRQLLERTVMKSGADVPRRAQGDSLLRRRHPDFHHRRALAFPSSSEKSTGGVFVKKQMPRVRGGTVRDDVDVVAGE